MGIGDRQRSPGIKKNRIETFSFEQIEEIRTFLDASKNGKNLEQHLAELASRLNTTPHEAEQIVARFQASPIMRHRPSSHFASAIEIQCRGEIWDELRHILPIAGMIENIRVLLDRLSDHGLTKGETDEFVLAAYLAVLEEEHGEGERAKFIRKAMRENLAALDIPTGAISRAERQKVKHFLKFAKTNAATSRRSCMDVEPPEELVQLVDIVMTGGVDKIQTYRQKLLDDGWPEAKVDDLVELAVTFQKIK